jgi:hypothetical protein
LTTIKLLAELDNRGVQLFLDGDRLRYRAPAGVLGPGLREALSEHRLAIVDLLGQSSKADQPRQKCLSCDPRNWRDEPPNNGRVRTTCGVCGRFIGYRTTSATCLRCPPT